jgi:hypothetical protein
MCNYGRNKLRISVKIAESRAKSSAYETQKYGTKPLERARHDYSIILDEATLTDALQPIIRDFVRVFAFYWKCGLYFTHLFTPSVVITLQESL